MKQKGQRSQRAKARLDFRRNNRHVGTGLSGSGPSPTHPPRLSISSTSGSDSFFDSSLVGIGITNRHHHRLRAKHSKHHISHDFAGGLSMGRIEYLVGS